MLLNFEEYASLGGEAPESAFARLELLAEQTLARYTQGRVFQLRQRPDAVLFCLTELIDALHQMDPAKTAAQAPLSGFSNDGYSESYAQPATPERQQAGLYAIVQRYLAAVRDETGAPLLYLGVGQ